MLLSEQDLKKILQQDQSSVMLDLPEFEASVMAKIALYNMQNLEAQTKRTIHREKMFSAIFLSLTILFGLIISVDYIKSFQNIELIFIEVVSVGMMIYCCNSLFKLWKYRPKTSILP